MCSAGPHGIFLHTPSDPDLEFETLNMIYTQRKLCLNPECSALCCKSNENPSAEFALQKTTITLNARKRRFSMRELPFECRSTFITDLFDGVANHVQSMR
jgi:hypothetical protein